MGENTVAWELGTRFSVPHGYTIHLKKSKVLYGSQR